MDAVVTALARQLCPPRLWAETPGLEKRDREDEARKILTAIAPDLRGWLGT